MDRTNFDDREKNRNKIYEKHIRGQIRNIYESDRFIRQGMKAIDKNPWYKGSTEADILEVAPHYFHDANDNIDTSLNIIKEMEKMQKASEAEDVQLKTKKERKTGEEPPK